MRLIWEKFEIHFRSIVHQPGWRTRDRSLRGSLVSPISEMSSRSSSEDRQFDTSYRKQNPAKRSMIVNTVTILFLILTSLHSSENAKFRRNKFCSNHFWKLGLILIVDSAVQCHLGVYFCRKINAKLSELSRNYGVFKWNLSIWDSTKKVIISWHILSLKNMLSKKCVTLFNSYTLFSYRSRDIWSGIWLAEYWSWVTSETYLATWILVSKCNVIYKGRLEL